MEQLVYACLCVCVWPSEPSHYVETAHMLLQVVALSTWLEPSTHAIMI